MTAIHVDIRHPELEHADAGQVSSPTVAEARPGTPSKRALWAGRILSGLAVVFLLFDALIKVLKLIPATEPSMLLGFTPEIIARLGVIQLICLAVYLVPRTSVLGAVLWTGYLGGAIATHVRVGSPLFSHTLFPIYVAALLWGGLWLRDPRVRALLLPKPAR